MANWDIPLIISNSLVDNEEKTEFPWMNKNRERLNVNGDWQRSRHSKEKYKFRCVYKIQGPLYDKKNWTKLQ